MVAKSPEISEKDIIPGSRVKKNRVLGNASKGIIEGRVVAVRSSSKSQREVYDVQWDGEDKVDKAIFRHGLSLL